MRDQRIVIPDDLLTVAFRRAGHAADDGHAHNRGDVFDRWAAGELDPTPDPPSNQYERASRINDPKRWQQ